MPKITDSTYFLPNITASEASCRFESGRTKPITIEGVCNKTFSKGEYVVKMQGINEVSKQTYISELIGAFIAMELDLAVPSPAVIDFTPTFVETLKGKESYMTATKSIGFNYGGEMIHGYTDFVNGQELSNDLVLKGAKIFAFDLLILNPDRGVNKEKQNMFTNGKEIIIFDHEAAFGFLYNIIKNETPWIFNSFDIETWIRKHHFFEYIREKDDEILGFIDTFTKLDDKFWDRVEELIPPEWSSENVTKIRNYLLKIIDKLELFKGQVKEILK